ncbi:hypothetical protein [Alishewanella jeotgali]|uniref:Transcriptional regulator n=1 Tax=Alishewanella jeotgali KCTC 22429 TaxID=1129374 RepID=H3Z9Q5_9ALTE|nr:hypothetical protein [Alishewanella jeotgali]EHR42579.1 hypothetical protein AJE_00280 [Alishewanella jeotgali KCTC 22429]
MQKIEILSAQHQFEMSLGKLVKHQRAQRMAQGELATRTGLGYFVRLGVGEGDVERFHGVIPRL